jgi:hypothetical protein
MTALLLLSLLGNVEYVSGLVAGGEFSSSAMDDQTIYLADGRGFSAFRLSDMLLLSDKLLPGMNHTVVRYDSVFYVAGSRGITALTLDPGNKQVRGTTTVFDQAVSAMSLEGDTLWFADDSLRLHGIELSSGAEIESSPVMLAASPVRIIPSGAMLYIACDTAGLYAVDFTQKKAEAVKLSIDGDPAVLDVFSRNNLIYLAVGDEGLWVAEPKRNSAKILTKAESKGEIRRLEVYKDRLAAAAGTADLLIYSIAEPRKPILSQEMDMYGLTTNLAMKDSLLLVMTTQGFGKVDLSVGPPFLNGIFYKSVGDGYELLTVGNIAVLAAGEGGIRTISIGDTLAYLGAYKDVADARRLYIFGTQVYVVTATNLLKIVDIKDPARPERRSFLQYESILSGLDAEGEIVLTAEDTRGVVSYWRCPCGPFKEQGRLGIEGHALDVKIIPDSRLVLVSASGNKLYTVSWKDSTKLETVSSVELSRTYDRLYLDGNLVIGLDEEGGLGLINASRPSKLKEEATLEIDGTPSALAIKGDTLYVAAGKEGVYVVDIADRAKPRIISRIDVYGARGVGISGQHLLVSTPYAVELYSIN